MTLVTFQSNEIDEIWPEIEPLAKKVLNKTELCYTIENIRDSLLNEQMQLWTSYDGTQLNSVCVTRIWMQPQHKSVEIILMAGELCSVPDFRKIEHWAKSIGCKEMKFHARKGWSKVLPDYKIKMIQLQKEL